MTRLIVMLAALLCVASPAGSRELEPYRRDHMGASDYRVGSRYDEHALGGFARSKNNPLPIGDRAFGKEGRVTVEAVPQEVIPYRQEYQGMVLRIVNQTDGEAAFPAMDSKLKMKLEARSDAGQWLPLEFESFSFCGNSFHRVFLPARHYWQLVVPRYSGSFRTQLRFSLQSANEPIYSNEFSGSIDPGQFQMPEGRQFEFLAKIQSER